MPTGTAIAADSTTEALPTPARTYHTNRERSVAERYGAGTETKRKQLDLGYSQTMHYLSYCKLLGLDATLRPYPLKHKQR